MKPTLLIHGGAGVIQRRQFTPQRMQAYLDALSAIAAAGQAVLLSGGSAVDAVAEAVRLLENNPLFNAGDGSVLTTLGTIEMDAAIMDGRDQSAGAVTCVSRLKNPVLAAKAVMQHSPHVCFAGEGAEAFAAQRGLALIDSQTLIRPERLAQLEKMRQNNLISLDHDGENALASDHNPIREDDKYGTVGAVALDVHGNVAAATSTGGLTNKAVGRVGDTPIIGAGCYADSLCAVSTTGIGEAFMRGVVAHDIAARMRYGGQDLQTAAQNAVQTTLSNVGGEGGLIAIDREGNFALPMNTAGMYRAYAVGDAPPIAAIFNEENQ